MPTTDEVRALATAMADLGWSKEAIRLVGQSFAEDGDDTAWHIYRRLTRNPLPRTRSAGNGARKQPIPTDLRWEVWERDDFRCRACGSRRRLEVDHIVPESKRGPTTLDNLQTLFRSCNGAKGNRVQS